MKSPLCWQGELDDNVIHLLTDDVSSIQKMEFVMLPLLGALLSQIEAPPITNLK
jgi:hypothetical protein